MIEFLKWLHERVDDLGSAIYEDCERLGEPHSTTNESKNLYHNLKSEVSGRLERELKSLAGPEFQDSQLCDNSTDSPPCHNLSEPSDESEYPLCARCRAAREKGLTYKQMLDLESEEKAWLDKQERQELQKKKIRAADPERAAYWDEQDRRRKERIEKIRKESEELSQ